MNTVVILYPALFKCFSKFKRKLSNILKNIDDFSVVYPSDPNEFIKRYFDETNEIHQLFESSEWKAEELTHGVIFDDGEELVEDALFIRELGIPLRRIKIDISRVINIKKESQYKSKKSTPEYEYIGRGSYWGNPYSMYDGGDDREEVIRKFKYDFDYEKFPNKDKSEVYKLAGKRLGCFCKPQACHGDILADYLNSWDDEK